MSDFFIGEIRLFPFGFTPSGWAPCDGRTLPIQQNAALFSLLNIAFGGDGKTTFCLPDLRGRVVVNPSTDITRINVSYGKSMGQESTTLATATVPSHIHQAQGNNAAGTSNKVLGNVWATGTTSQNIYGALPTSPSLMNTSAVSAQGSGQGHENMQPFQVLNYCISLVGIYPSRP